jgi:hypothetical protein
MYRMSFKCGKSDICRSGMLHWHPDCGSEAVLPYDSQVMYFSSVKSRSANVLVLFSVLCLLNAKVFQPLNSQSEHIFTIKWKLWLSLCKPCLYGESGDMIVFTLNLSIIQKWVVASCPGCFAIRERSPHCWMYRNHLMTEGGPKSYNHFCQFICQLTVKLEVN